MWEEIEQRGKRYLELKGLIESPEGAGSPQYAAWLREFGRLTKFGELWESYSNARKQMLEADALLKDPGTDAELKPLAQEEFDSAKVKVEESRRELVDRELTQDDDS